MIIEWLIHNNLAHMTGRKQASGHCAYPEMRFNINELMKYVSKDDRGGIDNDTETT